MHIRRATVEDAAGIAQVHVDSWRTTYAGLVPDDYLASLSVEQRKQNWRAILSAPAGAGVVYVAEVIPGHIVGFASGGPERTGNALYTGELYAIYLLAPYQRQGIGRRLMSAVVEQLIAAGHRSMLVWVLTTNPARLFYEALGGQPVAEQPINNGQATLQETAYGWQDIQHLAEQLQQSAR